MSSLRPTPAGQSIPHCEVVSHPLNQSIGAAPAGVARLRWSGLNRGQCARDLHLWLRLDELFTPVMKFRVELQACREATYDLPMFSAHRDFVYTGDPETVTDVAVGAEGDHGWVYGVVVVGAQPLPDTAAAGETEGAEDDDPAV